MRLALARRRKYSKKRLAALSAHLRRAEEIVDGKACVYVTGSFGRNEGYNHSDLDIFIVGLSSGAGSNSKPLLSNLEATLLKAELIRAVKRLKFPDFSGDGVFLQHYTVTDLIETLGTRKDDASNTFTARLLLLLESKPLLGATVYSKVIRQVVSKYWRDYKSNNGNFLPAFLANDILRLWRTLCVNYEAGTQPQPSEKKYKRRLKNYKLKHSRLLTCYSALLLLMDIWNRKGTVSPSDASAVVSLTPTERIERLLSTSTSEDVSGSLSKLLDHYDGFLKYTEDTEQELLQRIARASHWNKLKKSAPDFSAALYSAVMHIGKGDTFHRMLVV